MRLHALYSAAIFCNLILACWSDIFFSQEPSVIKCWKYMETKSDLASVFVSNLFDLFTCCLDTSLTLAHPSFTIFLSLISFIAASVYIIYCVIAVEILSFLVSPSWYGSLKRIVVIQTTFFWPICCCLASMIWLPSVVLQRYYFSFSVDNFHVYCYWWSLVYLVAVHVCNSWLLIAPQSPRSLAFFCCHYAVSWGSLWHRYQTTPI